MAGVHVGKSLVEGILSNSSRSLRPVNASGRQLMVRCEFDLYQLNDLNVVEQVCFGWSRIEKSRNLSASFAGKAPKTADKRKY